MRDIAESAGLALGATYYYFKTKDEIVLDFYRQTCVSHHDDCRVFFAKTTSLQERLEFLIRAKLQQWKPNREFLSVIARAGIDSSSALSPFSPETTEIRDEAIEIFREALEGTSGVPAYLLDYLPKLLWLYQLGIILFWINDRSRDQKKTDVLLDRTLTIILRLVSLARLPLMRTITKSTLGLVDELWK